MLKRIKARFNNQLDRIKYANALNVAASICNGNTFSTIKNCNSGKKVALCGGGPTLQKYNPMDDVIHIALNRALLYEKVHYDWFIADDWDGVKFFKDELLNYDCRKFFGHQICGDYERQIPESYRIMCRASRYYTDSYWVSNAFNSRFICDIDKMAIGNMPNIALSAMQIVLFTNPACIYLVGCDASQGHFIVPDSIDKMQLKRHEKDLKMAVSSEKVIQKWRDLKKFANAFYPSTEIVSINPVGLKGIFKDEYR